MILFHFVRLYGNNFKKTSSVYNCAIKRFYSRTENVKQYTVVQSLRSKIKANGPISISDYMKEALMNPISGLYMKKDVFGKEGHFITSPEISQLFGEMIAIWFINEWQKLRSPRPFQIVELGPGRGTMMEDILRVFHNLKQDKDMSVHLVEVSPALSKQQAERLCSKYGENKDDTKAFYMSGITKQNVPIFWYSGVDLLPKCFTLLVAHEFFDVLPIHKLQKTKDGWQEILVDIDPADKHGNTFRQVLSRNLSPYGLTLKHETRDHVEISPAACGIMKEIAVLLEENGGMGLVADYGHDGTKTDTFRAFRNHSLHDPMKDPGTADLTADVDFSYLRYATVDKLVTFGPVTQHSFLSQLQIEVRLQALLKNCTKSEGDKIQSGYHMIMDKDKMGDCFKFMAFFPEVLKTFLKTNPPIGFIS